MARNPVLAEILRQGRHQPRKRVLSAIETGLVESSLRNLRYGDGSSVGWRQETKSSYPNVNRLDVRGSVARFYQEAARADRRGQSPGQLAQAVQRSAYPGRYDQRAKEAAQLMAKYVGAYAGGSADTQGVKITAKNELDTAAFEQAKRGYVLGTLLAKNHGPTGPLFKAGLVSTTAPDQQSFMHSVLKSKVTHDKQATGGGSGRPPLGRNYPVGKRGKIIGVPYTGTHTLGNWQSDNAVDISVPVGTAVYAIEDGRIGPNIGSLGAAGGSRFAGLRVQVDGRKNSYWYGHLSKLRVKAGQRVRKGQLIGFTGSANGVAHLHLGVRRGDPRGIIAR